MSGQRRVNRLWPAMLAILCVPGEGLAANGQSEREIFYEEARRLLASQRSETAYSMLSSRELDYAGREGFDYLLGVAALDSGRPGEAIFAFQRLLAVRPDFAGARLDYARAYYQIGDYERARIEFEKVLSADPPGQIRTTVDTYLAAIAEGAAVRGPGNFQTYFDFASGYDSNPAAATDEELFLNFRLDPRNLEQSSAFAMSTLGVAWTSSISETAALMFNGRLDHRSNMSAHFVDTTNIDLGAAWSWMPNSNTFTLAANVLHSGLDQRYHRRDLGLTAAWSYQLSDTWQLNAFGRAVNVTFDDEALAVRDSLQAMGGLGLAVRGTSSELSLSLFAGQDDPDQDTSPYTSDTEGLSLGYKQLIGGGSHFFLEASYIEADFDEPFFGFERTDDTVTASVGFVLANFPAPRWQSTMRFSSTQKDSTVMLYQFDRHELSLSFRRVFQ